MKKTVFNIDKFKEFVKPNTPQELEQRKRLEEDKDWLLISGEIAAAVHKILRAKKMTQTDLAEMIGLTKSSVSKMLSGNTNFTIETIHKLERALDVRLISVYPNITPTHNPDGESYPILIEA